jgi:hypothetical protein
VGGFVEVFGKGLKKSINSYTFVSKAQPKNDVALGFDLFYGRANMRVIQANEQTLT